MDKLRNKLDKYLEEEKLKRSKKISLTEKVDNFFFFILNPYGFGFYAYLIVLSIMYYLIDHEVIYWSFERLSLQVQATFFTLIVLPSIGIFLHYGAKVIDKLRGVDRTSKIDKF